MNLKFHIQHDQTPRLQNSKNESGREFKMAAVTKNSKTNKIVIFSRKVNLNYLFSETTAPMIVKFQMQHDKAAGL